MSQGQCCMKLTSCNQRKERMRGGLKQLADHMHHVTRSMSNDLELPNSPKTVIRTYSNAARGSPGSPGSPCMSPSGALNINNSSGGNSKGDKEEIELDSLSRSVSIEIHNTD